MSSEPSGDFPIGLIVEAQTPRGPVRVSVSLDSTVGEFVTMATAKKSIPGPAAYELRVPMPTEDGEVWHPVPNDEKLLDALRGVQKQPQVIETGEKV